MAVNFGVVSKMNCSQQMDWKYNPVVLASALAQLMRQEIVLRLQGNGRPSQSEKNGLVAVWCKQRQVAKAYWHGVIQNTMPGIVP